MEEPTMTPTDAARELRELSRFDHTLRQRMEGVMWIVMGLTLSSLFFSYAFAVLEDVPVGIMFFLWIPWTAAGFLVVWSLRRSLALAGTPTPGAPGPTWLFVGAAGVSLVAMAALIVGGREIAPSFALLAIGVLALAPPLVPALGYTTLGRRVGLALGALGVLGGVSVLVAHGDGTWGTWAAASVCFCWVLGGAYQVLQG